MFWGLHYLSFPRNKWIFELLAHCPHANHTDSTKLNLTLNNVHEVLGRKSIKYSCGQDTKRKKAMFSDSFLVWNILISACWSLSARKNHFIGSCQNITSVWHKTVKNIISHKNILHVLKNYTVTFFDLKWFISFLDHCGVWSSLTCRFALMNTAQAVSVLCSTPGDKIHKHWVWMKDSVEHWEILTTVG